MSRPLEGMHYCRDHQGNHSHYASENCEVCRLRTEVASRTQQLAAANSRVERMRGEWKTVDITTPGFDGYINLFWGDQIIALVPPDIAERIKAALSDLPEAAPIRDEEQQKNAERYRWLREQHWNDSRVCVVARPKEAVKLGYECPSLDRLDAIIDSEMKVRP